MSEKIYDAVIIGSGFGGSINALRLAEAGREVLVLERGKRYEPKDFPRDVRDTDKLLVTADRSLDGLTPTAQAFLQDATRVTGLVTEPRIERALGAVDRAAGAAEQAEDLMLNANGLLKDLRAGKGTAGALLSRSEVYTDLRELIRDLRRHPWKVFWKE